MTASIDPSSRTIIGPLTTTFTAPATCTTPERACSTCNFAWQAQTCYSGGAGGSETYGVKDATQCWPPTSAGFPEPTPPLWGWGFYSPGLICPTGYTSACSATAGHALTWTPEWSLAAGETAVGCCPSQYVCTNNQVNVNTCQFVVSSTSVPVMTCKSGTTTDFSYLQVPLTVSNTIEPNFTVYAPLIQINWQSSDLSSSTFSTAITASSSTITPSRSSSPDTTTDTKAGLATSAIAGIASSTVIAASSSTITPSSSSSPETSIDTKAGLATGAIAGIAIGASLVVIAFGILLFLLLRKPNKTHGVVREYPPTVLQELNGEGKQNLKGAGYDVVEIFSETKVPPAEMDSQLGTGPPVEIDTGRLGR